MGCKQLPRERRQLETAGEEGGGILRCLATEFTLSGIADNFLTEKTICVNLEAGGKEPVSRDGDRRGQAVLGAPEWSKEPHSGTCRWERRSRLGTKPTPVLSCVLQLQNPPASQHPPSCMGANPPSKVLIAASKRRSRGNHRWRSLPMIFIRLNRRKN